MALLNGLVIFAVVIALGFFQAQILLWTTIIGALLIFSTFLGKISFWLLIPIWLLFLSAAIFANVRKIRERYFTVPFVKLIKNRMPAISRTEQEAIEAGNVWWEKELFCGRPNWKNLFALPKPELTAEENAFLSHQVETLCSLVNDWEIVNDYKDMPEAVWQYLKSERFFGLVIPKKYGGHGFSALAHSSIVVKIATRSISVAVNTMVPNSLGPGELILHYGTQAQKDYYLPRLAKGEEIPCFALTGPEAGSDAAAMTDFGIVAEGEFEGKKTLGIRLNWNKRYITLAPVATVVGIAFRLFDPQQLLGKQTDLGVTLCLVPATLPGVEIGNRHLPLQLAFMNGPTRGKDVFIPLDYIIGGIERAGQGWRMLMECLSVGRSISLPALSTACGKLTYRLTGAYAKVRRQFNTSISNFEGIQEALGSIAGLTYLLESCRVMTAGAVDLGVKPAVASAIAKYNMTEMARDVLKHAMDVQAGNAIQVGPRNFIAHAHLAIPVSITVEGANILTRNLIIFGQGAIRCHPYLLSEVQLLSDETTNMAAFDKVLLSHVGYSVSNLFRNIWFGLTGGKLFLSPVRGPTARYYRQLTRMSSALSLCSDVTMLILGGDLKRKERISARLGDILSQLYLGSTVLKYFRDQGEPTSDLDYVKWCIEKCLYEIQHAFDGLLNNFPNPWLGKFLRGIIFPYGRAYQYPKDKLLQNMVKSMLLPSDFRDRLSQHVYLSQNEAETAHQLEVAFKQLPEMEPILKKYYTALKKNPAQRTESETVQLKQLLKQNILTASELTQLKEFLALQNEIIQVNEFSFDLKTVVN